jgi:hypothetical protein
MTVATRNSSRIKITIKPPKLADYQKAFLNCPQRFSVVEASTKTGKTFSHIYWLFRLAHGLDPVWYTDGVKPGWNMWWVAPVYSQAKIAFARMKRHILNAPGYKFNNSDLAITTPKGTIISFKSADTPDNLYGEDVYGVVFDEFTRAKQAAWFALRSTVTFTKAPVKFIGNYTGQSNWGHKLTNKAKTDPTEYAAFRVTAYDAVRAGILDEKEIEQARQDLPLSVFTALYLAEGVSDDSILFPEKALEDVFTNTFVQETGQKYITADIALHGSDRFVIRVWHGWVVIATYVIDKCDADEVEKLLREKALQYGVPQRNIAYDADGVGAFLRGYLKTAQPFNNGAAPIQDGKHKVNYLHLKAQCFYLLAKKISDNGIYIKSTEYKEQTILELENIRKHHTEKDGKITVTPKEAIKQVLGFSPDLAESLMMRMVFELPIKKFAKMI